MKKVLFITTRLISPVNSGTKVVLYNYCKGLNEKFNCEIYQYSFYEDESDKLVEQPKFIKDIRIAEQPKLIEKLYNIFVKCLLTREWPLQVALYYSKDTHKNIIEYINNINPEIVICDLARTAEYIKHLDSNKYIKVLEMQDLISKRYKRQAENLNDSSGAFGAYTKNLDILKGILSNKLLIREILKYESRLLEKYEINICKYFKKVVFVAKDEAKQLNTLLKENKCFDVSLGIDYEYFSEKIDIKVNDNIIGFIGNMNIAHNKDAANNFINNILPGLVIKNSKIKFRIIGMCTEEYKRSFEGNYNVEVTGPVDDLREYCKECAVIVAPLTYGSGIKTKVLESMAMGIPVVTNSIGCEGINASNGDEMVICENNQEFINEINKLLYDREKREEIGKKGQKFVKENFIWEKNLMNLQQIFN